MDNPRTKPELEPAHGNVSAGAYNHMTCKYAGVPDGSVQPAKRSVSVPKLGSEDMIAMFKVDGYCVIRSALSTSEVARLRAEYIRLATNWQRLPSDNGSFDLEAKQGGFNITPTPNREVNEHDLQKVRGLPMPAFRKLACYHLSDACRSLAHQSSILDVVSAIVGDHGSIFLDAIFPKVARLAREKPWHHDAGYWLSAWAEPQTVVQSMTVIDPHRPDNGALQVISGSHRKEWQTSDYFDGAERKVNVSENELETAVSLALDPGDVLLFDSRLLHASMPNGSDDDRCVIYNAFSPSSICYRGKVPPPELPHVW